MPSHTPRPRAAIETWIVPLGDGWDPHMDLLTGRVVCGNEVLSLVNPGLRTSKVVATTPARLLRWLSPDRLAWQHSTGPDTAELWTCPAYDLAAVTVAPLDPATVCGNTFAASRGRWSSWLSKGLRLAAGTLETAVPLITGVYECQMAADWLVTTRDQGGMVVVWLKWNGTDWLVVSESITLPPYPQCWLSPSGHVGVGYYGPAGVIRPGEATATDVTCTPWAREGIPRVIEVEDVLWVVTASLTPDDDAFCYARPLETALDPAHRLEVVAIPVPFGFTSFDGRGTDGRLELAGCDATGRLAWLSVNLAALPAGPIGPTPPIPPQPAQEAPRATITSYQAGGTAPMACRATWAPEASSGPIDEVRWLVSPDNRTWSVDAVNPATDPDHTFHFETAGMFFLRLVATGPGGTSETRRDRRVIVMPEDITPSVPMVETSAFRLPSGFLLCADQHDQNRVNATREGEPREWESFIVEPHAIGGAWVALKSDTGYVCTEPTGHQLRADGTPATAVALRLIEMEGAVAIMASDGFYLWAENGGGGVVLRNGSRIDEFSTFTQVPGVPKEKPAEPEVGPVGKPSREAARAWRSEFLAAPNGCDWAFMGPGWSRDKLQSYIDWAKPRGQLHLPWAAWGSYPNSGDPTFDYSGSKWPQFLELVDWVQAQGMIVAFFCLTDQVWGGSGFTEDWAHNWIRSHVPDLVSRVRMYVNGWEFVQINSAHDNWWTWDGDANIRILKTIRQVVGPDNYVMCHFTPERITGHPPYQHGDNGKTEPQWWHEAGSNLDGILYQRPPDEDEHHCVVHTIGGTDEHGTDIGDVNRIVGNPSTWDLRDKVFIAFEYSRDLARGERLSRKFSVEPKVSGWGNMGNWNGKP
jgi:hypothetical protein